MRPLLVSALLSLSANAVICTDVDASSWPQHRGPNRNGVTSEPSGWDGKEWPIRKRWQAEVGMGCTSPLLVDGKVYVMGWKYVRDNPKDRRNPIGKDIVTCLDVRTGKTLWRHEYEQTRYVRCHRDDERSYGGPTSTPTLDPSAGRLYVHGLDGEFRCLDSRDGTKKWSLNIYDRFEVPPSPGVYPNTGKNDYGCISSPLVYKNQVILEVGSLKHGTVIAFDKMTGEQIWASAMKTWAGQTPGPQFIEVDGIPCLATLTLEHLVIVRLDKGHEGETLAKTPWKAGWDQNLALPAISGNKIMLTGYHWINGGRNKGASAVYKANRSGIQLLWKSLPCSKSTGGTIFRDTAYVASDNLHCLDLETGKPIWRDPGISGDDFGCGASVIISGDEKLIYLSEKNTLYLAEPGHRSKIYKRLAKVEKVLDPVRGQTWPHVVLAEKHLLVKDKYGNIACYATNGAETTSRAKRPIRATQPVSARPEEPGAKILSRAQPSAYWPRFRGPGGRGTSQDRHVPIDWDEETGQNIRWKSAVALAGASSPIVWGNHVYLSGANKRKRVVYCYEAANGRLLWTQSIEAPKGSPIQTRGFENLTYAGSTPVTDGDHVFAIFGNGDLASINSKGKTDWVMNLGNPLTAYSHCTSLELYRDLLIVQLDQGYDDRPESRLLALHKKTGKIIWEKKGKEHPVSDSWSSPIVARTSAGDQLITRGGGWIIARRPKTGHKIWQYESKPGDVSTSPVFAGGMIISAGYGDRTDALLPNGKLAWTSEEEPPEVASPLAAGRRLYLFHANDRMMCLKLATGQKLLEHEFGPDTGKGVFYASPLGIRDNIYALRADGSMVIFTVRQNKESYSYVPIGKGRLRNQTHCWATPAVANGCLFIRSKTHLYCIGVTK